MPRIHFRQSLDNLKDRLLAQAALAQQSLDTVTEAYETGDMSLCDYVLENEHAINSAEQLIDSAAYDLLAMEQPMAVDLRFILSVIKINSDLERVGDQCVNIADRVRVIENMAKIKMPVNIPYMARQARTMVRTAVQSLIEADAEIAESVMELDDEVDEINRNAHRDLTDYMMREPETAEQAINALIVCRNLERVADHATNIAEDVIFWLKGADIRHSAAIGGAVTRGGTGFSLPGLVDHTVIPTEAKPQSGSRSGETCGSLCVGEQVKNEQ